MATIFGTNDADFLDGMDGITDEHDFILGADGDDTIDGLDGDDYLKGGGGADKLIGGAGNDTVFYGDSATGVVIDLAAGFGRGGTAEGDTFIGIENVTGSYYDDVLQGNSGDNVLSGSAGRDVLTGALGADTLDGGDGVDEASYDDSTVGVFVSLITNQGFDGTAEGDRLVSIEDLRGSDHGDLLVGNDGDNSLTGLNGDDTLKGGTGADRLFGDAGNDILYGGSGADTMNGGTGNDTYYVDNPGDQIGGEWAGGGFDTVRASISFSLAFYAEVEMLSTTNVSGTAAINLTGNVRTQQVIGNNGANVLNGGFGNDTLTGNGGTDSFLFTTSPGAGNVDNIADFNVADDTIWLDNAIFRVLSDGPLEASFFHVGFAGQDANDYIIYDSSTGGVWYDADGVGGTAAIQFAQATAGLAITHADFLVV